MRSNTPAPGTPLAWISAAMLGHAVGDAMGVPVEFMDRATVRRDPVTGYRGYGSHPVPAGVWSDDTSMAIATLDSLADGLDYDDMMRRFCDWQLNAAYTATDVVFDEGITIHAALKRYREGTPALECGSRSQYDNGNGSLMRIIPAVLYCRYRMPVSALEAQMDVIHKTSQLTHAHPRAQMGCGIYALVLLELLRCPDKQAIAAALEQAEQFYGDLPEFRHERMHYRRAFAMAYVLPEEAEIHSGGYVVETLEAALWCVLTTQSYGECICKAVNLGGDTDTVAAVAGGLAGVLYGIDGIPPEWRAGLIRREKIEEICSAFAESIDARGQPLRRRMIDVHSHMLFGVDDGTRGIDMAVEMLRMAQQQGVTDVLCTSHSFGAMDQYWQNFHQLRARIYREKLLIRLHPGCEIFCSPYRLAETVGAIRSGNYPAMAESECILIEFDPYETADCIEECVRYIRAHAPEKTPVIAHVERCRLLHGNPQAVEALVKLGCLLQINAYSLQEESDESVKGFARRLLAQGYVTFLGSDAHRPDHRPPAVARGMEYIYAHCDRAYADAVCYKNAQALLLNG